MGTENINYIANYLLSKGFNKNSIIAVLINMGQESGWNPYADEKPSFGGTFYPVSMGWQYSHGYGLVQYSYTPIAKNIYDYCHANHTEWECIKYQLDIFPDELGYNYSTGGSWNPSYDNYGSFINFWTNKYNRGYQQLTADFLHGFERGEDGGRFAKYAQTVLNNVKWDGVFPDGAGESVPSEPKEDESEQDPTIAKIKMLSMQDCLSFLDKARPSHETSTDPTDPDQAPEPSQPATGAIANVLALWQEGRNAGLQYSQPKRSQWPYYADCSAFVTRCVNAYMGLQTTTLYTTDSLHDYIISLGWSKVYEGDKSQMPLDSKEADIIITGKKGQSLGNAGHTLFVTDSAGTTIECTGIPAYPPYGDSNILCKSTLQAQRDVWLRSSSYWYKYRRN